MESIYGRMMSSCLEWTCFFFFVCIHEDLAPRCYQIAQSEITLFLFQVNTAVKFLQNPKVRQSPLATRKAFLKKKGEGKAAASPWKAARKASKVTSASQLVCVCWQKCSMPFLHGGGGYGSMGVKGHSCSSLPWGSDRGRFGFRVHDSGPVNKWHTS